MKKKIFVAIIYSLFCINLFSVEIPQLTGPVVDTAKLLNREQFAFLDSNLRAISDSTGSQVVVLTIKSLEGLSIEEYTMAVAEKWQIGSSKNDDGVILCVSLDDRKIRIEVGYGLEGYLTDAKCGLIIRNIIAPSFSKGEYGEGIVNGVKTICNIAQIGFGDYEVSEDLDTSKGAPIPVMLFIFFIYFVILSGALANKFPGLRWLPWYFLFKSSGNRSSHYNNSYYGASFGGGSSFGGGGFSGGGGGFGGGGASGG